MIEQHEWIEPKIFSEDEMAHRIGAYIEEYKSRSSGRIHKYIDKESLNKPRTLFTLNPDGGRLGPYKVDRDLLQQVGISVLESNGLDQTRYVDDESISDTGGMRTRVYPLGDDSNIEFVRLTKHLKPEDRDTATPSEMGINTVKWMVRFSVDPEYLDILP